MSDASTNVPSFSRSDIRLLVSGYTRVGLRQWGQIEIFAQVLGQGPMNDRSLAVIAWELDELTGHVVCVVDPCSTAPWFLRIVITPDFVFLGLYWAGVDSIGKCPLTIPSLRLNCLDRTDVVSRSSSYQLRLLTTTAS